MASNRPLKPWERATGASTSAQAQEPCPPGAASCPAPGLTTRAGTNPLAQQNTTTTTGQPPPVPSRNYASTSQTRAAYPHASALATTGYGTSYGGYGTGYGSYSPYGAAGYGYGASSYGMGSGYGMGGMGGMYGGYGRYGSMMGTTGQPGGDADFVRVAEESSRQAFQSIESIVQAFASVSMMLESTYFAVYSSFRAVLGVADHFSRLRNHLGAILGSLALLKTLRWFVRRLGYLLGLVASHPSAEDAWTEALRPDGSLGAGASALDPIAELLASGSTPAGGRSSWPIMIFFAVVLGTPYVIWRLLSSIGVGSSNSEPAQHLRRANSWATGETEHFSAVALYPFQGTSRRELSLAEGEQIRIAPRDSQPRIQNWLLAARVVPGDGADGLRSPQIGLVPLNYVKVTGKIQPSNTQANNNSEKPVNNVQDD